MRHRGVETLTQHLPHDLHVSPGSRSKAAEEARKKAKEAAAAKGAAKK